MLNDYILSIASCIFTISLLPQIYKIFIKKQSDQISLSTCFLNFTAIILSITALFQTHKITTIINVFQLCLWGLLILISIRFSTKKFKRTHTNI